MALLLARKIGGNESAAIAAVHHLGCCTRQCETGHRRYIVNAKEFLAISVGRTARRYVDVSRVAIFSVSARSQSQSRLLVEDRLHINVRVLKPECV